MTYDGVYRYYYDCENRLTDVNTGAGVNVASYKYDFSGRRVKKVAYGNPDVVTTYCYDGDGSTSLTTGQIVLDYNEAGVFQRRYFYGPGIDEPIAMMTGGQIYYYHFDGLGSVVGLSDSGGSIVEKYKYDVYGKPSIRGPSDEPRETSSYGNRYLFTGREYDSETGLYYYRARYYKPSIGRFLQTDPIYFEDGLNLYVYCENNPLNWIDPWGLAKIRIYIDKAQPWGDRSSTGGWGHTWVEIESDTGEVLNRGFYPGGLHDDTKRNPRADVVVIYDISEERYKRAKGYVDSYHEKYRTISENCTDFVYKVAEKGAGVDLPGSDWGIDYPDKLAEDVIENRADIESSGGKIKKGGS